METEVSFLFKILYREAGVYKIKIHFVIIEAAAC